MNPVQFREEIVIPTLKEFSEFSFYSKSAVNLLLGTVAAESSASHFAEYVRQLGKGTAVSIFQLEPDTIDDIFDNYLKYRPALRLKILTYINPGVSVHDQVKWDLALAIILARVHYRRVPEALPRHDDVENMAAYYKKYYNTVKGKSSEEKYIALFDEHVGDAAL